MAEITREEARKNIRDTLRAFSRKVESARNSYDRIPLPGKYIVADYDDPRYSCGILAEEAAKEPSFIDEATSEELARLAEICGQLNKKYSLGVRDMPEEINVIINQNSEKRETPEEIMCQIKVLQQEMADWQTKGGGITSGQYEMFIDLAGQYNNATIKEGKLSKDDYVSGGRITTEFEEAQDAVGSYQVNLHSGIDIVGGDLKSPFFMRAVGGSETDSNAKIFSIIGTELRMKVLHGDAGTVRKTGDFFKPGDVIMPFPKKNNFRLASTGAHFHIELSDGSNFINPYTLKISSSEFKRTIDGGKSWKTVKPNF